MYLLEKNSPVVRAMNKHGINKEYETFFETQQKKQNDIQ
jgi:hypothetical protein